MIKIYNTKNLTLLLLLFSFFATSQQFVFDLQVPANTSYSFELISNGSININWGDGQTTSHNAQTSTSVNHNYVIANTYTVTVTGQLYAISIGDIHPVNIKAWGTSQWQTMNGAFEDCVNLSITAVDMPDLSHVINMGRMFKGATNFNSDISNWDVSNVIDMSFMFGEAISFNQPLDTWDVSSVTDMSSMFALADNFNQPLNTWNVSSVTNMSTMFISATSFNQPLDTWDVSSVTDMSLMFANANAFNQSLDTWDVSSVVNMSSMFFYADIFNQPLNTWDVSNVTDMSSMFHTAISFNQPLSTWDVSSVIDMRTILASTSSFNQDLSFWNFNSSNNFELMVADSGLSVDNYDALLARFVNLNLNNFKLDPLGLEYCDSFSRSILIQRGWNITGDTQSNTCANITLSGTVLYDVNNNGCDPNDLPVNDLAIEINDGNLTTNIFTNNGQYDVNLPPGTYTVAALVDTNVFNAAPLSTNVVITNTTNAAVQDFCLTAPMVVNDLEVSIMPLEDARPGFDTNYKLIYKNKGNTTLSGSVDFTFQDDYMNFLNSTPVATTSSVGNLSWAFTNLDPFETREIIITMNLNTPTDPNFPLNNNDTLTFNAVINSTSGDNTPLDNVFDFEQLVVNSYDPNDKTCLQGETILPSMVGEYVHYRIRFENEGTASAINIRVVDYIDTTKYDISTLTPLSGSHDYRTTITEGNKVEFFFDNIMLPFTTPSSQGYILFKIKTVDTLVLGDDFSNQAEIYFDFNLPIITNLETTMVAVPASLNDNDLFTVSLFPNPVGDSVTLTSDIGFNKFTIYNTTGSVVNSIQMGAPVSSYKLDLDSMSTGLYFIEVESGEHKTIKKMIKQ